MLRSVDLGAAGDFVAGVLRGVRVGLRGLKISGVGLRTVSMYSPLACLGGIFGGVPCGPDNCLRIGWMVAPKVTVKMEDRCLQCTYLWLAVKNDMVRDKIR